MAQKTMFGENLQSVALDQVNDITSSTGLFGAKITVDTLKETFNVVLNAEDGQRLAAEMHDFLLEIKSKSKPTQTVSGADELLKYKQLLDAGVLTQAEFDAKKRQILAL